MKDLQAQTAQSLDALLGAVRSRAETIVTAHVEAAKALDKNKDWAERSNLRLFMRGVDTPTYEWSRIKWYGRKGARKLVRIYIPKPRGKYMYNLDRLMEHAQDWEAPMVVETEKKLAKIRKQQAFLVKARTYLRMAMKAAIEDDQEDGDVA